MMERILTNVIFLFVGLLVSSLVAGILLTLFSFIVPALARYNSAWPLSTVVVFLCLVVYGLASKSFPFKKK